MLRNHLFKSPSPYINHFISADTIVPEPYNPQNLNRYSYVMNNPLRYTDPTGHMQCEEYQGSCISEKQITKINKNKIQKQKEKSEEKKKVKSKASPDYYVGSLLIPFIPEFPIIGIDLAIVRDAYGNWYGNVGIGISLGPSASIGGGWMLGPDNEHEYAAEDFLQGHSFNASGGFVLGGGVNNVNPYYIQSGNEGAGIENIALEGLVTSPGVTSVFSFGWLIYDNGDDTPWIWQGD